MAETVEKNVHEKIGTEKYLIVTIQEKCYALPSRLIGEVAACDKVFPLPLLPEYVRGIINRYSAPYALIDIGFLLFHTPTSAAKVIVLKEEVDKLAFIINDVTDIADVPPEALFKIEQEENEPSALISASFEWKGARVFCLEIQGIISRIQREFT